MLWYADNSELIGIRESIIPDILLFGGIAVPSDVDQPLKDAVEKVKEKYGEPRFPVKWNFKDLKSLYIKRNSETLYNDRLTKSKEWRAEIFEKIKDLNFTIIISCIESLTVQRKSIKEFKPTLTQFVFSNGLMRLALHVEETKPNHTVVVLDWPDKEKSRPFDKEYASAYNLGKAANGNVSYYAGPLKDLGFTDSPFYAKMHHSTPLQLADLILGATREFIECALEKKPEAFGLDMIKIIKNRFRGAPNEIFGRGINVSSRNKDFCKKIQEYIDLKLKEA